MDVEMRSPESIRPYDRNPRKNDHAVEAVARSIREFGFRQPIVVDEQGVIVVGHTRWKAARHLGLDTVPVHVAAGLTPEQARAYRIADNQLNTLAEFDFELLPIELAELKELGCDLTLLGWDGAALGEIMAPAGNPGLVDPDEVPLPPEEATTQPGDLIILGPHRLACGDSGSEADLDRLLDGQPIHLVNTDPPYNVRVEPRSNNAIAAGLSSFAPAKQTPANPAPGASHHQKFDVARHPEKAKGTSRRLRAKDRPLANDFVSDEAFARMLGAWFGNASRVLVPGGAFYIWGGYAIASVVEFMDLSLAALCEFAAEGDSVPTTQASETHDALSSSRTASTSVLSSSVRWFTCGESRNVARSSERSAGSGAAVQVANNFSNAGPCGPLARKSSSSGASPSVMQATRRIVEGTIATCSVSESGAPVMKSVRLSASCSGQCATRRSPGSPQTTTPSPTCPKAAC